MIRGIRKDLEVFDSSLFSADRIGVTLNFASITFDLDKIKNCLSEGQVPTILLETNRLLDNLFYQVIDVDAAFSSWAQIERQMHHDQTIRLLDGILTCLLYTSPSPRDLSTSRMPSSA